ncbi:DUF3784 domain-containing protein [Bizionia sp. KMM 8389]
MIITAIILILFAVLIKNFKCYNLMAGYNTMSDTEKETYKIEKIAALFAKGMYIIAAALIIGYGISKWLDNEQWGNGIFLLVICIVLPYILIKSNSNAYKNTHKSDS